MTKSVSVIPAADLLIFVLFPIVVQNFFYFLSRKAEIFTVTVVQNRIGFQIIHAAENAFFRHAENSCEKAKSQMWIILQAAGKEITHEIHDFRIKIAMMSLLYRCIVFINNDNTFLSIMLVQQQR